MRLVWIAIIGLVAGALAKWIMPGKDPGGIFVTMGLGLGGALIANFLGRATGWYPEGRGAGIVASTLGAIVILAVYRLIKGKGSAGEAPKS